MPTAIANPLPATVHPQATDCYFTVAGARLRYRDEGSGPALLLVHGWTLDLEMWNALSAALRPTFRVIRLDRRGFGLSSGQPALQRDIADLDALWGHLGLQTAALLGMSQGARVVLGLAAASVRRISCLVLDGPPDIVGEGGAEGSADGGADENVGDDELPLAHYRDIARTRGIDAFRRQWSAHPLIQLRTGDRNAHQLLHAILSRYPGSDLLHAAAPARPSSAPLRPEDIALPVLVITGAHDAARRVKSADRLAQRLPCAERAVVADAGHLPNLDNPVAYNNLVRAFLQRHPART